MASKRQTVVGIEGPAFHVGGRPTYEGRAWRGMKVEGLLLNSRMVQGIFDDLNPETRSRWDYPDGPWDPDRNTDGFVEAMPAWRRTGLLSFTINLQGGNPYGYSKDQPWHNSTFRPDGSMRREYLERLERILDRADELGMAPILGYFYFGQDQRLADEAAVIRAAEAATDWLLEKRYTNVLVEIGNEVDAPHYVHEIIKAPRCHELIELVQNRSAGKVDTPAGRLLVSASFCGNRVPTDTIAAAGDFLLVHGNGVEEPDRIREMVGQCRALPSHRGRPILFNEDDHYAFGAADNNLLAAIGEYASWGLFDYRRPGEGFDEGYQSVPANWGISSDRKRAFFRLVAEVTGNPPPD
jgi:hypothetical protein